MFITQAHSFKQQARLAITLAWVAGYTNGLTLLTCHTVTSHVSGTTSNLGIHAVEFVRLQTTGSWSLVAFGLFLIATFGLGAMLSGVVTEIGRRKGWESIYVLPMACEAVLLGAFAACIEMFPRPEHQGLIYLMTGLASCAMGLQNATITRISNGVIRTTHMTGVLTDLGMETGQALYTASRNTRASRDEMWQAFTGRTARRLALLASILGAFAFGAAAVTLLYEWAPRLAMFPPVLFLCWIIVQDVRHPIAELEPSELVKEAGLTLPASLVVFHLKPDSRRSGVQRLPNLFAWNDRLDETIRVAILDLGDILHLDPDAAIELRAAATRLRQSGRRLILAGVGREQYAELKRAGGGEILDPHEVCPDLDIAIAHGVVLAESLDAGWRGPK